MPLTVPSAATVATDVLLLLQMPPGTELTTVVACVLHTVLFPVMVPAFADGLTVSDVAVKASGQPPTATR